MSLYDYSLYVVREAGRGDLFADAVANGVVRVDADLGDGVKDGTCISGRVGCAFGHWRNESEPVTPIDILEIGLDDRGLEALLRDSPDEFLTWLWQIATRLQPAYIFMPGGGDHPYFEAGESVRQIMFTQLPRLVGRGEIAVVHPVMFFA